MTSPSRYHIDALCPHRWRIGEANGPTSPGTCSLCGATKTFRNSVDDGMTLTERRVDDRPFGVFLPGAHS